MTIAENKKAYFNYEVLEPLEAGIVLKGHEVKAAKIGKMTIAGSYVSIKEGEVYLIGASIAPYQKKNTPPDYDPQRPRKILLKKEEVKSLIGKSEQRGLTIAPLKVYTKRGRIKLEIAVVRGKRKHDKREAIKKREAEREISRVLKRG